MPHHAVILQCLLRSHSPGPWELFLKETDFLRGPPPSPSHFFTPRSADVAPASFISCNKELHPQHQRPLCRPARLSLSNRGRRLGWACAKQGEQQPGHQRTQIDTLKAEPSPVPRLCLYKAGHLPLLLALPADARPRPHPVPSLGGCP